LGRNQFSHFKCNLQDRRDVRSWNISKPGC
jgi:hypothetical protein